MGRPSSHDDLDGLLELEDRFHAAGYQQGARAMGPVPCLRVTAAGDDARLRKRTAINQCPTSDP